MESIVSTFACSYSSPLKKQFQRSLLRSTTKHGLQLGSCSWNSPFSRRCIVLNGGAFLTAFLNGFIIETPLKAEEKISEPEEDLGLGDALKSFFDPNEKTKSGKILPKSYLKSVMDVVKNLRESLEEDGNDVGKFRRTADAAKESIREYLSSWGGQKVVAAEESYISLEKAIRSLASFYAKAGPFASMPDDVKASILEDLNNAEASL